MERWSSLMEDFCVMFRGFIYNGVNNGPMQKREIFHFDQEDTQNLWS